MRYVLIPSFLVFMIIISFTATAQTGYKLQFKVEGRKDTTAQGVYFLVLNKTKIFEFLVGKTQHFSLDTKAEDYVKFMKVTGDNDNKIFFESMVFNMERHKEADPFLKVIQDSTLTEDKKKSARERFLRVNEKVTAYQLNVTVNTSLIILI